MPEIGAGGVTMADSVTGETAYAQSPAAGSAAAASRGDHTHGSPAVTRDLSVNDAVIGFRSNQAGIGDALVAQGGINSLNCKTAGGAAEFRVLVGDSVRAYHVIDAFKGVNLAANNAHLMLGAAASNASVVGGCYAISGVIEVNDCAVISTGADNTVVRTTTVSDPNVLGVYTVSEWGEPMIARRGKHPVTVLTAQAVARGDILVTSATAGQATVDNAAARAVWLGKALTAKAGAVAGTVMCEIMAG